MFSSGLLPPISSIFFAACQSVKLLAWAATANAATDSSAASSAGPVVLRIVLSLRVVAVDGTDGHSGACDGSCDDGRRAIGLSIHLLGPPRLERGGAPVEPPRGHKAWGLLVYLLRTRVPPSRESVASLLFPEADDPLGTLRWTLSTLRRSLGDDAELGGDPVRLTLRPGTLVDVDVLRRGAWLEAVALPGLGRELLEGLSVRSSPAFELWLDGERRHVAGMTGAVLHEAALALLARDEADEATRFASERSASIRTRRTATSCSSAASERRATTRRPRAAPRPAWSSSGETSASSRAPRCGRRPRRRSRRSSASCPGAPGSSRRSRRAKRPSPPARSKPAWAAARRRRHGAQDRGPRAPCRSAGHARRRARPRCPRDRRGGRGRAARGHDPRRGRRPRRRRRDGVARD